MKDSSPEAKTIVHKLNHRPEYELYHLSKDPYELKNQIDNPEYSKTAKKLKKALHTRLEELGDSDPIATETALVQKGGAKKKGKKNQAEKK